MRRTRSSCHERESHGGLRHHYERNMHLCFLPKGLQDHGINKASKPISVRKARHIGDHAARAHQKLDIKLDIKLNTRPRIGTGGSGRFPASKDLLAPGCIKPILWPDEMESSSIDSTGSVINIGHQRLPLELCPCRRRVTTAIIRPNEETRRRLVDNVNSLQSSSLESMTTRSRHSHGYSQNDRIASSLTCRVPI